MQFSQVQLRVEKFVRAHGGALRKIDFVVGISRGGLIPAALIATRIDRPLVAVYIDRQDRVYCDRTRWLKGTRVLLVDDIVRTGSTLKKMIALLKKSGVREMKTFTLFCRRTSRARPTWTTHVSRDQRMPWDL